MKDIDKMPYQPRQNGGGRIFSVKIEVLQDSVASVHNETLTEYLMEEICKPGNLNRAYKRVKANKGAAGTDGMTVEELSSWIRGHKENLIESLLTGRYKPQSVRGVEIPKPGGKGVRLLGIPCALDRLVQQAIL